MMRKIALLSIVLFSTTAFCQVHDNTSSIKLFLASDSTVISGMELSPKLQNRLLNKVTQLINQTGVAEVGYSNFWVQPKLDVINTSTYDVGMTNLNLAECELFITISRKQYGKSGGAVYKSFSKRFKGSAMDKQEAVSNAINSISASDIDIIEFFKQSKVAINQYFNTHCNEVIREAEQAYELGDYGRSIALYFSIPSSAPCYLKAQPAAVKVYKTFRNDECKRNLIELKALVATIQKKDLLSMTAYSNVMAIIRQLDPNSDDCYNEALIEVKKVEKKFDDEQKREWESAQKRESNDARLEQEWIKAMGKINASYQPGAATKIIITQ